MSQSARTILVVDDLEAILAIAREFLEAEGFAVLTARNALEAFRAEEAYTGNIDLLLTDTRTPGTNGFLLAGRLKILRPEMAVIFMSAIFSEAIDKKRIAKLEALFLWKPFTRRELLLKVNRVMTRLRS